MYFYDVDIDWNSVDRSMREDADYIIENINWEFELDSFEKAKKLAEVLAEAYVNSTSKKYHSYQIWDQLHLGDWHAYAVLGDQYGYAKQRPKDREND